MCRKDRVTSSREGSPQCGDGPMEVPEKCFRCTLLRINATPLLTIAGWHRKEWTDSVPGARLLCREFCEESKFPKRHLNSFVFY